MKLLSILTCLSTVFMLLVAYPSDFDETRYDTIMEAQSDLMETINSVDFTNQLQEYSDSVYEINNRTYDDIRNILDTFSRNVLLLQESSGNLNVSISGCLENLNFSAEAIFEKYTEECVDATLALGRNIVTVGKSRENIAFKKFNEIMNHFNECVNFTDPNPRTCAGVMDATQMEIERIQPRVKVSPLQTDRELKQQLVVLYQCGYSYVSGMSKKLQDEFYNSRMCILDKINTSMVV